LKRESKAFADGNQVYTRKKCRPLKEYSEKNQNSSHIELKGQALE
jgi:hypothetical protein